MKRYQLTGGFAMMCIAIVIAFSHDSNKWLFVGVMTYIALMIFFFGAQSKSK